MSFWWVPVEALWLMLPAYVANMAPVLLAKVVPWWKAPIDGGRTRPDGTRLLGDGKTWRGLVGGAVVGGALAWLLSAYLRFSPRLTDFGVRETGLAWAPLALGTAFGLGALVGDAVKSFFKRKLGIPRGSPWIGPDQLDFVVGGLLFAAVAGLALPPAAGMSNWTVSWLVERWWLTLFIVVVTPLLHWVVNVIGFWLKLKSVPW